MMMVHVGARSLVEHFARPVARVALVSGACFQALDTITIHSNASRLVAHGGIAPEA